MHPTDIDNKGWTIKTNDTLSDAEQREDVRIINDVLLLSDRTKENQTKVAGGVHYI